MFSIRTPTAVVEDLGTEFGVEVLASGETASHVFAGRVVMRTEGAGGGGRGTGDGKVESGEWSVESGKQRPKTQDLRPKTEILLSAGQSARVESGKNEVRSTPNASADPIRFVRAMPPPRAVQDSLDYEKLVLSLDPAVYFRMEKPRDNQRQTLFDFAPGGHHGQIRLGNEYGGSPFIAGRFGSALMLRGPDAEDYAIVPDYPKAAADKLTVSAWVFAAGRPGWAMIAANWGHPTEGLGDELTGQFHLGLFRQDGDLSVHVRQRDRQLLLIREGADHPFPLGAWQHVALVADGEMLRLYRNGEEVAAAPCAGVLASPQIAALGIGCKLDEMGTDAPRNTPGYHYWQGRIDELAIFNEAFSAEQIRRLSESYFAVPKTNGPATEKERVRN